MPDNEDQNAAESKEDAPNPVAVFADRFKALEDAVAAIAQKVGVTYSPVRDEP